MNGRLLPFAAAAVMAASLVLTGCGAGTAARKPGIAPTPAGPSVSAPQGNGSGTTIRLQPIGRTVEVADGGRRLVVGTETGGCERARLVAHETGAAVTLALEVTDHRAAGRMCPQFVKAVKLTADLASPLGSRPVFDADGHRKLVVVTS